MTWILWILSVSSDFVDKRYFILQIICKKKKKKKKRKERKRGHKRIETKSPCNNSDLVIPFKHDQVLLNFQC
jgi:hypothetical protein